MKRFFIFFITIIIALSIYYDLNIGTLPMTSESNQPETAENETSMSESANDEEKSDNRSSENMDKPAMKVMVENGQTVLTIVEKLHEGSVPVAIDQIVHDFSTLNDGLEPTEIQVDQTYWFPVYEEDVLEN